MGRALVRLAPGAGLRVVAGFSHANSRYLGQDLGVLAGVEPLQIPVREHADVQADVLIDFTTPAGAAAWAQWCASRYLPLVSGTTGLNEAEYSGLRAAAAETPVVWAANMSLGVNVLLKLVSEAAEALGADWDIEIVEAHHRHKADAPSGTAAALLSAVQAARGAAPQADDVTHGRSGLLGPRPRGQIGVHALRLGAIVGEHEVHLAGDGEVLTLAHRALSRDIFARGALRAARWIVGRKPGLYSMRDVLA